MCSLIFCIPQPVEQYKSDISADNEQRYPHHISCGHSFCSACLKKYLELGRDSRCPLCRRDFRADIQPSLSNNSAEEVESLPGTEMDTLVLTLSEQECWFFEQLYRDVELTSRRD
uniref:Uncharacterized protein, isoform C n=1 Tax=Drosophila melanogaster TaxID=7227 RepID=A0A0B4K6E5_DROME|nr:uncharacterized protein Dmel_CG34289, isoform C [Drosophila melanogaster]AFH06583.1 uncharacterized protein Dmel_CG34289, isoform C [Drosophila melanogaster]|eukprot:NP_001247265.1 uncharacterized protein Dmel_CG34289, isoform C [Drosophila melanogaster]